MQKAIEGELGALVISPQLLPDALKPALEFLKKGDVVAVKLPGGAVLEHSNGDVTGFTQAVVIRL